MVLGLIGQAARLLDTDHPQGAGLALRAVHEHIDVPAVLGPVPFLDLDQGSLAAFAPHAPVGRPEPRDLEYHDGSPFADTGCQAAMGGASVKAAPGPHDPLSARNRRGPTDGWLVRAGMAAMLGGGRVDRH